MKKLLALVLLLGSYGGTAFAHPGCDCTEYPVPGNCADCCGVAKGVITAATTAEITLSTRQGTTEKFTLTERTRERGEPKAGANVTVVYKKSSREIGLITTKEK